MRWLLSKHWNKFRDRNFHLSAFKMDKVTKHDPLPASEGSMTSVPVRPIDKILFVWSGKYKSREEVPDRVARAALLKCHSVCRVKTCNYMIALTLLGSIFYIMMGKRDAKRGHTVAEMNRQWHREYNKKFEEQEQKSS